MRKTLIAISVILSAFVSIVFAGSSGMPRLPERADDGHEEPAERKSPKYVDMKSDAGRQTQIKGEKILIAVGNFAAHHNGTVITCDSTVRYSDSHLECFGNVLIKKGTTYIYGDRADYNGEKNEAHIFSDIIKVVDQNTTMYTYNFTFNTQTNIGTFTGGGVIIDDNNRLEADKGYYNADTKEIICVTRVEMRDDKYRMKGDSVIYNMDTNGARFFRNTNIWNIEDNEYLYADCGEFDDAKQLYRLTENGYILTEEQEVWSDSLDYYRDNGYALLKHNVQIDDVKNKVLILSDWGEYWKEPGNAFLTNNPVLVSYDAEQGDSLYIRSDSMYLYTRDPVAERIERERIARHIADSIALADSLQRVAQMAEAEKVVKKDDEQVDKSEQGPMKNKQRQDLARNSLDKNKRDRRSRGDEQQEQQELNEHQGLQIVEEQVEEQQGADSLAVDSLVKDSLALDSLINPIDTLTDKQRKALAKLAEKEAKQQLRDSLRKIKEDSLRVKLDRIADARQAKRTAYYKNLERIDSLNRVKAQARADKKLRRRIARLNRKGISILPVHDSIFRKADSVAMAELLGLEAVTGRVLDSLIDIYYPKLADTTAMATDTIPVDSTYKMIIALRNVRMFRSDAQMVCDSLVSRSTDSIIHLYKTPVLWSEANQITSDSMHIFSHEGRLVKAMFDGHPLIVAELDTAHYNQVTGKEMVSYFNDKNELYRNDVKGNVQTIYYMQEQDSPEITMMAYVESGDMTAYLENRQLKGITYRTNPTYFFYPIDKIPESQPTKLDNFKWEGNRRPARDSVLNRTIRPSERDKRKSLLLPNFPIERALNLRKQRLINQGSWMDRTDTLSIETIEWVESVQD
ncbi:MAG: hypothetical protein IKY93_02215 [Alistipes sp.]|nr:hypothetical protein [Alistipes sp.]